MGRVPIPANARVWNKRRRWLDGGYLEDYRPAKADLPGQEITIPDTIDIRDSSIAAEELMDTGQRTLDAPDQDADSMEIGLIFDGQQHGNVTPEGTYVNHGVLMCDRIAEIPPCGLMDLTYST